MISPCVQVRGQPVTEKWLSSSLGFGNGILNLEHQESP
jgi:hypothetical protein